MYLEENKDDKPKIYFVETRYEVRFKTKDGAFSIYDRKENEKKEVKSIDVIAISDSRFSIDKPSVSANERYFSGLYQSTKQKVSIVKMFDGKTSVIANGDWKTEVKPLHSDAKFTKHLFCIVDLGDGFETADFKFNGLALMQWLKLQNKNTKGVLKLKVSDKKDYKLPDSSMEYYQIVIEDIADIENSDDEKAKEFSSEVKKMYESYDASYVYYNKPQVRDRSGDITDEEIDEINKDIPVVVKDDKVRIDDVPF